MRQYLKAENLKFKRTFTRKLILLIPFATLFLTWLLSFNWYQVNVFNWWYVLMMPGYIALISALSDQKEVKKLGYRGVLALPVSLKKIWIAKVLNLILYAALSCLILLIGILLGRFTVPEPLPLGAACLGMLLIFATSLWQIPFCLFLSRKIGMVGTILICYCQAKLDQFWQTNFPHFSVKKSVSCEQGTNSHQQSPAPDTYVSICPAEL